MKPISSLRAFLIAFVGAGSVLAGTAVFAHGLQRRDRAVSHQQPEAFSWSDDLAVELTATAAEGRTLYLDSCAHCHGADATGDEGPDLHGLQVSDRYIAHMITFGEPHEMPSFAKKHGAKDIASLTAYLRSLKPE